jgi:hypothetical protein
MTLRVYVVAGNPVRVVKTGIVLKKAMIVEAGERVVEKGENA